MAGDVPDLDRLIAGIFSGARRDDPLARLASAAQVRDELDELTEALLDHFVEEARKAGCSWSQIGRVLGVSKQAVQQRHTATDSVARRLLARLPVRRRRDLRAFFGRFTDRARASVAGAERAAERLCHNYIGTEHLLLGMLAERDCVAAKALAELGVTTEDVETAVIEQIGRGHAPVKGSPPFTPRVKRVLNASLKEALALGHNYIGTEHILLATMDEAEGVAAKVLARQGIHRERVRSAVVRLLAA